MEAYFSTEQIELRFTSIQYKYLFIVKIVTTAPNRGNVQVDYIPQSLHLLPFHALHDFFSFAMINFVFIIMKSAHNLSILLIKYIYLYASTHVYCGHNHACGIPMPF